MIFALGAGIARGGVGKGLALRKKMQDFRQSYLPRCPNTTGKQHMEY
jgi:hypothetical protein